MRKIARTIAALAVAAGLGSGLAACEGGDEAGPPDPTAVEAAPPAPDSPGADEEVEETFVFEEDEES